MRAQEGFRKPDMFGIVECTICKYAICDASSSNPASKLVQIYKQQIGHVPDAYLYRALAIYWNDHVATLASGDRGEEEEEAIPMVNVSQVEYHFCKCYRRRNIEGILFDQLDKLLKIQQCVYENGVFVRTITEEEQAQNDAAGIQRPAPSLTQDAHGNIIDEYANTARCEPPDDAVTSSVMSGPMFAYMTDMIRNEMSFIRDLKAGLEGIDNPAVRARQEQCINRRLTKVMRDIGRLKQMQVEVRKKSETKRYVHCKEAMIVRDYSRAIYNGVRYLKEWREVSSFMDGDCGQPVSRKARAGDKRKRLGVGEAQANKKRVLENFESY